jgi:hypothetical protein
MVIVNDPNARDLLLEQETNIYVKALRCDMSACNATSDWLHKFLTQAFDTDSEPNH